MTSIKMKDDLYKEKIGSVKIRRKDTDEILNSVIYSNIYPFTIRVNAQIDFFNVKSDHSYLIIIYSMSERENKSEVMSIIYTDKSDMVLDKNSQFGKTTGYFDFNLTAYQPQDTLIYCVLIDTEQSEKPIDDNYTYLTFTQED